MVLLRWALGAASVYGLYKLAGQNRSAEGADAAAAGSAATSSSSSVTDGLSAIFATREQAELAVEHLVQEYKIERATIYVEPVADENSSGVEISGGDHASGDPGSRERHDAALKGAIEVSTPATTENMAKLRRALEDTGAIRVEAF